VICDRATAIRTAILQAQPGDGILIAGKGHEDYQILGTEKIHFDDRERTALMEGKIDVTIAPYLLASASAIQYSLKLDNMTQYGQTVKFSGAGSNPL